MQDSSKLLDQDYVDRAFRRAVNTDVAIGLISLAPFLSLLWKLYGDPRFSWGLLEIFGLLYLWTSAFLYGLIIRKVRSKTLWASAWLYSTGVFCSCLTLAVVTLPSLAVGVAPIATYWIVKLRARGYFRIELMQRAASTHTGALVG